MKKKYIQLPKGYLSYSQLMLWQNDRKKYIQIYMDGRDELRTTNKAMEYGKVVATALENSTDTGDLLTDSATLLLPKYDIADQEIRTELKTKDGWVSIVGRPDTMDSVTHAFREYKTGKTAWTKSKAQNHPQMRFYAMVIYLAHGTILDHAYLDWIQTEYGEDGTPTPTGHIESFKVNLTTRDLYDTMAMTSRAAKEIAIAWAAHVPDPKLTW